MDDSGGGAFATVIDTATRERVASLVDGLPSRLAELESQGVGDVHEAAEHLCADMERMGAQARRLILRQPPRELLGYVYAMHHMNILGEMAEQGEAYRPNKGLMEEMQFLLEHVHAAWSCSVGHWPRRRRGSTRARWPICRRYSGSFGPRRFCTA